MYLLYGSYIKNFLKIKTNFLCTPVGHTKDETDNEEWAKTFKIEN